MKKQSQDLTNEQLHIEDAAAVQEEYSLEDIMNEFGGWSKRSEPKTPPLDTAQTLPEQKPEQSAPAEEADAPDTKIVRFPAQAKRFPEEKEEKQEETAQENEVTGTIDDIKDFMFVVTDENDTPYSFTFEEKPEGLESVNNGDTVTVKYTGTISEVDPFEGEVLSVEKTK